MTPTSISGTGNICHLRTTAMCNQLQQNRTAMIPTNKQKNNERENGKQFHFFYLSIFLESPKRDFA
jgi:hypothetical protein